MNTSSNHANVFYVLTCLTGTDKDQILSQSAYLQGPVPPKGSPEYQEFLSKLQGSPANVISSIAQFVQNTHDWNISSADGFQSYLDAYNGAPIFTGFNSGPAQGTVSVHTVDELIDNCLGSAGIPSANRAEVAAQLGLADLFAGDFESTPVTLSFIVQNMQSNEGAITMLWTKSSITVTYSPPQKSGIFNKKPKELPTYTTNETGIVVAAQARNAAYFSTNAEQYLSQAGFTNIMDWCKKNTTPA